MNKMNKRRAGHKMRRKITKINNVIYRSIKLSLTKRKKL